MQGFTLISSLPLRTYGTYGWSKRPNFEKKPVKDNYLYLSLEYSTSFNTDVHGCQAPDIMNEIFQLKEKTSYHLRLILQLMAYPIHIVYNGFEFLSYLEHKTQELILPEIKAIEHLAGFKEKIKIWKPNDCHCRLCKVVISNTGFT